MGKTTHPSREGGEESMKGMEADAALACFVRKMLVLPQPKQKNDV